MAGILIIGSSYNCYSFSFMDDTIYKTAKEEYIKNPDWRVYFSRGYLTPDKLQKARDKVSEIVKRLNDKEKVNVKKELSSFFR